MLNKYTDGNAYKENRLPDDKSVSELLLEKQKEELQYTKTILFANEEDEEEDEVQSFKAEDSDGFGAESIEEGNNIENNIEDNAVFSSFVDISYFPVNSENAEGHIENSGRFRKLFSLSNIKERLLHIVKILAGFYVPRRGDKKNIIIQKVICIAMTLVCISSTAFITVQWYGNVRAQGVFKELSAIKNQEPTQEEIDNLPESYLPKNAVLYAVNNDYRAWINIKGTVIDYPIVQGEDNLFYRSNDFYKNPDRYGTPFIDSRCNITADGLSTNILVYGSNVKQGTHFNNITNYQDLKFYIEHPIIDFDLAFEDAKWKVLAAFETTDVPDDGSDFYFSEFIDKNDDSHFDWYISEAKKRSFLGMPVDVNANDTLLTLSTTYGRNLYNGRFVVIARKVREGESLDIDMSNAYKKKDSHILRADLYYNTYKNYPKYNPIGSEIEEATQPTVYSRSESFPGIIPSISLPSNLTSSAQNSSRPLQSSDGASSQIADDPSATVSNSGVSNNPAASVNNSPQSNNQQPVVSNINRPSSTANPQYSSPQQQPSSSIVSESVPTQPSSQPTVSTPQQSSAPQVQSQTQSSTEPQSRPQSSSEEQSSEAPGESEQEPVDESDPENNLESEE